MPRRHRLKPTDIGDAPEAIRLADEVRNTGEPLVLARDGEDVAVLIPMEMANDLGLRRPPTEKDIEAFRSAAGAWKDVDTDSLIADIYAARGRPVVSRTRHECMGGAGAMAHAGKSMDVRDVPELVRLAREVHESGEFRILRDGDKELALVSPMEPPVSYPWRAKTEADYEAFRSAAGSWKGIVDVEQFLKDNEESRRLSTRPPVEL